VKRSPELSQLSRDHHQALYAALRLRRAGEDDAADAVAVFDDFWRDHGRRHFQIEEEVLLPGFAAAGGDADHELVARVLTDHVEIRARASKMTRDADVGWLNDLGERLAAHVRLEEDELFPLIERTLEPGALAELGAELERAERVE
jgi:hemerythrin-like domain-containing protein